MTDEIVLIQSVREHRHTFERNHSEYLKPTFSFSFDIAMHPKIFTVYSNDVYLNIKFKGSSAISK